MERVLVIGATGRVGREVLSQLPAADVRIRALVRDPQAVELPPNVELVRGDLNLPETLAACLDGIDAVFLVWCASPAAAAPALERILRRTGRVVFLSAPLKTPHPFFQQPNPVAKLHAAIEQQIESSGRPWTFLRPGMFAANTRYWWASKIRDGANMVGWPYIDVLTAPIHQRDIAAVAVRALCHEGHAGAEYVLTGPQSLSQSDQIATIGAVIGRTLRLEEISPDEARSELLSLMPISIVNMLLNAWGAAVGLPAHMTQTVAEITGSPARTFRDWATDYAAAFRG